MTPLTVCCVWVQGHVPYKIEFVTRLASMVKRHLHRPHTFVCLTDRPALLKRHGIETMTISPPGPLRGWWSKLEVFRPGRFTGRVLFLDLDSLVMSPLEPIVDYPAVFALVPHVGKPGGTFEGKHGLTVVKRFNSSVMIFDGDTQTSLYTTFTPDVADRLWGDQDWIGEQCTDAVAMPAAWFPRVSEIKDGPVPDAARVVLCKKPKNQKAAGTWKWVRHAWA